MRARAGERQRFEPVMRRFTRPRFLERADGGRVSLREPAQWLRKTVTPGWISLGIALVSLWFAMEARSLAGREPDVLLIGPDQVRLAQGEDYGYAYFYLQPVFVSTAQNDRVEVIRDMYLEVVRAPDSTEMPSGRFEWNEQATLTQDPVENTLSYEYVADAGPLLISPRMAQQPLCVFNGPAGWYFEPGEYQLRLVATRVVGSKGLTFDFRLSLSADDIAFLNGARGNQFLNLPIEHVR